MYQRVSTEELINRLPSEFLALDSKTVTPMAGTKHCIKIPLKENININGDICRPELIIINSYNRESSLLIGIGIYRFVCSNGLLAGTDFYSERVLHIRGKKLAKFLDEFDNKIASVLNYISTGFEADFNNTVEKDIKVPVSELLDKVPYLPKKVKESVNDIYNSQKFKRDDDFINQHNIWGLLNIVNEELEAARTSRVTDGTLVTKNNKLLKDLVEINEAA